MKNSSLWIILQRMRLPFTVIMISYSIAMTGLVLIPGVDNNGNTYHFSIFEAFYFITYTATTIGFGEIPYAFTHYQKIWVSISIYLTVLGWFYGIGTLVSLLQDRLFLSELALAKFKRDVSNIKEDFVIVLGYNETTSFIIQKMIKNKMRVVVIEKEQQRADILKLEGFIPHVPVLVADVHKAASLEFAGIKSIHCKGVISLFQNNALNMRVTLASKILNPHINIAVKATTDQEYENLLDAGANIVQNPFSIISHQIQMALNAPSLFKIKNWLYKIDTLESKTFSIPKDNIIVCGYGRLGKTICQMFHQNNITPVIIEKKSSICLTAKYDGFENIIEGNAEDKFILQKAGIKTSQAIIIATNDDTTNLSISSTVKMLNKKTMILSRENELSDFSIFNSAKIDYIFIPQKILIQKTTNAIVNPLCDRMIKILTKKDEKWANEFLAVLLKKIHHSPETYELTINKNEAIEVYNHIKENQTPFNLKTLCLSRRNHTQMNNIIPLLIVRNHKDFLLPGYEFELKIEDKILFASDENGIEDLEYIINNMYEFHYALTGLEKKGILNL